MFTTSLKYELSETRWLKGPQTVLKTENVYITKFNCYYMHWFLQISQLKEMFKASPCPFLSNELNIFKSHSLKCQH